MIAIGDVLFFTVVSMFLLGALLTLHGVVEAVQAFRQPKRSYLFLHLLGAVLSVVIGILLVGNPGAGAAVLTLAFSVYFIVSGLFRIIVATLTRLPSRGWFVFNGVVAVLLGIMVLRHWPSSATWVLGFFVGFHLLVGGWARVMLALAVRRNLSASG
jgi:uncharacterized membrane protein HdeD (DUF308 family)